MRVQFEPNFPVDLRRVIEPILALWAPRFPGWCRTLTVAWDAEARDFNAQICAEDEYLRAHMTIGPGFFDAINDQEVTIVHEMMHVFTAPMYRAFRELINAYGPDVDKAPGRLAKGMLNRGHEASIQELAHFACDLRRAQ